MRVRVGLSLAALGVVAVLASVAAASTGAMSASAKIAAPSAGHFSITPISVRTRSGKKPKLHIVGAVGKNLVVAVGLTADPKIKGRFIGAVVLMNRKPAKTTKARSLEAAARSAATFVVVSAADSDVVVVPSLREAICRANAGDTIIVGSTFFANPPGVGITPFMDASFASACGGSFGTFNGASAGDAFLNNLAGNTIGTTTTPPASGTFTIGLAHVFGAGSSSTNDCETVTVNESGINVLPSGSLTLTGPNGFSSTNPLTFTPSGPGVFVVPSTFLLTAFGPYTESAKITVNGTTNSQTGTFFLDASNDKTTGGCQVP